PQGYGAGGGQGSARRLQEGTGGAVLRGGHGQARPGGVLPEQRGVPEIRAAADRRGTALHCRARAQAGVNGTSRRDAEGGRLGGRVRGRRSSATLVPATGAWGRG